MSQRKAKSNVKKAAQRTLERALMEERLALSAITKVMLLEVPDAQRVLARLDAMARAAESNPKVSAPVRKRLIDGTRFVRSAVNAELGIVSEPNLFDPPGEPKPEKVTELIKDTDGPQQLGLEMTESILGDVESAHEDRVQTIEKVHDALIAMLRANGAMTDQEIHQKYLVRPANGLPPQSRTAIRDRRLELCHAGRLVRSGTRNSAPCWDVVERDALQAAS